MMRTYLDRMMMRRREAAPIREISKVELRPGEIVVVRFNTRITMEQVDRVREVWKGICPDNKIVVFENCAEVSVLAPTPAASTSEPK